MQSAKMMRMTVLMIAVAAVAGVMAVLACGPASPAQQSVGGEKEKPTETPTPTPTLHPDCVTLTFPDGSKGTSCPPLGPKNVETNLRRHYNGHMANKEKAAQDGRRSAVDPVYIGVTIETTTLEAVDTVADFLEANSDYAIYRHKNGVDLDPAGAVVTYVNLELVPTIAAMDGVMSIRKNQTSEPQSSLGQASTGLSAADLMGADGWHAAGITGSGVEVAVLDRDFRDFRTRVVPRLSEPANFLCFDSKGRPYSGQVPDPTPTSGPTPTGTPIPTPTSAFVACEMAGSGAPGSAAHGTEVSGQILDIAPGAVLRVSNPDSGFGSDHYTHAVDWLTAKDADNSVCGGSGVIVTAQLQQEVR